MTKVLDRIVDHLKTAQIDFKLRAHEPTPTSQDSARVRGESLSSGAKAILYKVKNEFYLFVLAAHRKLDPKKIKLYFKEQGINAKKSRFASLEELETLTGLIPGAVPPFGKPIFEFQLFVDPSLLENEDISFNAGSLEHSITMKLKDYVSIANPIVFEFS